MKLLLQKKIFLDWIKKKLVKLTLLNDKRCKECQAATGLISQLKSLFPGLEVEALDYMTEEGKALYESSSATNLPLFLFDNSVTEGEGYQQVKQFLTPAGDLLSLQVGANFDPSHMMWMGGNPLAAIRELGDCIFHIHAKDTRIDPQNSALTTRLETRTNDRASERAWNYVTLGYGHSESWWRDFVLLLRQVGYNDVLSIEHEDVSMSAIEGVRKSVQFLKNIIELD